MIERTDRVNWSTLKHLRPGVGSPKHYRHALVEPRKDSDALLLGRLVHAFVYEPDQVDRRYVFEPRFHGGMNDDTAIAKGYDGGKQTKATWTAEVEAMGAEIVSADLYQRGRGMRDALLSDPHAAPYLIGGYAEQLVTWTDRETGIECRGRVDHVDGCLSDLKTAAIVLPRRFNNDIVRLGYHAQLAFYADGLAANGIVLTEPPALVVVESVRPHDVLVIELSARDMDAGRAVYRECLAILRDCRERDRWPGLAGGSRLQAELPAWAMPDEQEITLGGVSLGEVA